MVNKKYQKVRVPQIKAFLKKHKKYFKVNITKMDKEALTDTIEEMIGDAPPSVKSDYKNLLRGVEPAKPKDTRKVDLSKFKKEQPKTKTLNEFIVANLKKDPDADVEELIKEYRLI
jgi:5'-deoxynucleotidase YfbR-like HD superfamily hydrolase